MPPLRGAAALLDPENGGLQANRSGFKVPRILNTQGQVSGIAQRGAYDFRAFRKLSSSVSKFVKRRADSQQPISRSIRCSWLSKALWFFSGIGGGYLSRPVSQAALWVMITLPAHRH
jgi:hypothetical protein